MIVKTGCGTDGSFYSTNIFVTFYHVLPISVTGANDTISVSFTSYTNLGSMMSDNNTGAVIRCVSRTVK